MTSTRKNRKNYTGAEKVAILRRHLLEGVAVSELCREHSLQPTVFYRWQQEFFENGAAAFERGSKPAEAPIQRKVEALEARLAKKDEVIGELMGDYVALKKTLGAI